jgi:protein-S-isoprenylcysteine O-methyltransferase
MVIFLIVILPTAGNLKILYFPQLWIIMMIGIFATLFQPSYNPLKKSSNKEDRGTALQIIWSVYLTQLLTIMEAAYMRFPESIQWDYATTIAVTIMFFGLTLRSWAVFTLGKQFTWHIDREANQTLIRFGPFRFLRHPGYTGAFLTYMFTAIFLHSWFSFFINIIVLITAFLRRIHYEEKVLEEIFGKEYLEYCGRVKKMMPGVW